jgi:multisubunit Na+/H+ antiporter MnhF subunit
LPVVWFTAAMSAIFVATFVIASPYSLWRAAFVKGLLGEVPYAVPLSVTSIGSVVRGIAVAIEWPAFCAGAATIGWLLWTARRSPRRVTATDFVLIAWSAIYTLVLIAPVHEIYLDYALPLVPPAAMLAGRGAVAFARWLGTAGVRPSLATAGLCLVAVSAGWPLAGRLIEQRHRYLTRDTDSDLSQVANWLECRADTSARIAYDHFVYVPPAFAAATVTWGGTRQWLTSLDPDIVIVNRNTAGYASAQAENAEYYRCLAAGTCGYQRVLSRGALIVYGRQDPLAERLVGSGVRRGGARCP